MRKFKKFYIALLGGILALGVGTSSLVSSVSPTSVKAWDTTVSFTFVDSWTWQENSNNYEKTIDDVTLQVELGPSQTQPTIDYDAETLTLYPGNALDFISDDYDYYITSATFTFLSGTVNDFTSTYDWASGASFTTEGDNTVLFSEPSIAAVLYVSNTVVITQIDVTLDFGIAGAMQWANDFIQTIRCDGDGAISFYDDDWDMIAEEYNRLSEDAKAYFTDSSLAGKSKTIDDTIERYDFIIGKYGENRFNNFMGRDITTSANAVSSILDNIDYITIIAVSISVLALTSIATFIIIYRKRKLSSK